MLSIQYVIQTIRNIVIFPILAPSDSEFDNPLILLKFDENVKALTFHALLKILQHSFLLCRNQFIKVKYNSEKSNKSYLFGIVGCVIFMNKAPDFPVNNQTYSRIKKHCGNGKNHKNVKSVKMIVENRVKNLNYSEGCNKVNEDCKCVKLYINQIIFKSSKKVSA